MSRRRSRPSEIKANARFELISRVIFAAFTMEGQGGLILDPTLLFDAASFALTKQTDPRGQQPAGDETARTNENGFPDDQRDQPVGNCAAHDRVADHEEEKVQGADEQKPA